MLYCQRRLSSSAVQPCQQCLNVLGCITCENVCLSITSSGLILFNFRCLDMLTSLQASDKYCLWAAVHPLATRRLIPSWSCLWFFLISLGEKEEILQQENSASSVNITHILLQMTFNIYHQYWFKTSISKDYPFNSISLSCSPPQLCSICSGYLCVLLIRVYLACICTHIARAIPEWFCGVLGCAVLLGGGLPSGVADAMGGCAWSAIVFGWLVCIGWCPLGSRDPGFPGRSLLCGRVASVVCFACRRFWCYGWPVPMSVYIWNVYIVYMFSIYTYIHTYIRL